ncbi:hypothetical protein L873DRAFT_1793423 [Choiromyces venosus 120613-1]|uniref:t-SNARE coiled-coil homology domain-containing protein n=1 Tax=Choiromyces venosus 120613-1 TaxID=1336337 RepID=A0A3N4J6N6_9PEZI|nr:hypothetical protein L873DRAFT_1793423 [Choiromyces venosus 120613-1]
MFRLVRRPAFKLASTYRLHPKVHYPCRAIGTTLRRNADDDSHHDHCDYHASNIGSVGSKSDSALFTARNNLSRLDKDVSIISPKLDNFESGKTEMKGEIKEMEGEIKDLSSKMERKFEKTDNKIDETDGKMERKFEKTDNKIDEIDGKMERKFDKIYEKIDEMHGQMHNQIDKMHTTFGKLLYGIITASQEVGCYSMASIECGVLQHKLVATNESFQYHDLDEETSQI